MFRACKTATTNELSLACIPCKCRFRHAHVKNFKGKEMFKNLKSPLSFGDLQKIRYLNYPKTSK